MKSEFRWESNFLKENIENLPRAITIGNFDGVHLGHQFLLEQLKADANRLNLKPCVLTFNPHPVEVISPNGRRQRLFDFSDQAEQLSKFGVHQVFVQNFDREFSELSAEFFIRDYICKIFKPEALILGHDFRFGEGRSGDFSLVKSFVEPLGIYAKQAVPFFLDQQRVSTSGIRKALLDGNVHLAKSFLGRPYYLRGVVTKGEQRGRKLGFPTANINPTIDFVPKIGVYLTQVSIRNSPAKLRAVTNVGINRSFNDSDQSPVKFETHILDFSQDLYGESIKVEFLEFFRDEAKFNSVNDLIKAIKLDVEKARSWKL